MVSIGRKGGRHVPGKSKRKTISRLRPISDMGWGELLAKNGMMGTYMAPVAAHLGNQLWSCLWLPQDLSSEQIDEEIWAALYTVMSLDPQNELEGMLAVQAIATHNAGMECMRRAMLPDQTVAGRDINLKHAEKLFRIFNEQAEVLRRSQRAVTQLSSRDDDSQAESEETPEEAAGENDDRKVKQIDNLHDIRALIEKKQAG